jgi:hypothetical protein
VKKCGGEKALTKNVPDEGLPKYHMPLEEANKIIEHNIKMLDHNALAICSTHANPQQEGKLKLTPVKARTGLSSLRSRVGKIMHKLYDLEPDNEPEKPLNIDLGVDLYQMEDF